MPNTPAVGERLTANLQKVQEGRAYGVDQQGNLMGEALKASFKGKLVAALVQRGIAREGNVGGRVAAALVGRDNFKLIADAQAGRTLKSSIANTLQFLEGWHTEGLDRDLASQVSTKIFASMNAETPIEVLTAGKIRDVERAIVDHVIPNRIEYRQGLLDAMYAVRPTEGMLKADQAALSMASNLLQDGVAVGSKEWASRMGRASGMLSGGHANPVVRGDYHGYRDFDGPPLQVSGRQKPGFGEQVAAVVDEFNLAVAERVRQENNSAGDEERHATMSASLKSRFTRVIDARIQELDKQDGMHVRLDGKESAPVKANTDAGTVQGLKASQPKGQTSRVKGLANSVFEALGLKDRHPPETKSVRYAGTAQFAQAADRPRTEGAPAASQRGIERLFRRSTDPATQAYLGFSEAVERGLSGAALALDRTGAHKADLPRGMGPEILNENTSAKEVLSVLTSGDRGIRRGTTALQAIRNNLRPETLPSNLLNGSPDDWKAQTERISAMAAQIASASFSPEVPGDFTQYGTSQNNPFAAVVDRHPELDQNVRNWLDDGLGLTSALHEAQDRPLQGLPPLDNEALDQLQARVNEFARIR